MNPHAFRHASATHKGMEMSVARLKWWHGWSKTETAENYVHENEERMREKHLEQEGVTEEGNGEGDYAKKECGRCGSEWPPTQNYCGNCSLALDRETAEEARKLEKAEDKIVEERMDGTSQKELIERMRELEKKVEEAG